MFSHKQTAFPPIMPITTLQITHTHPHIKIKTPTKPE